VSFWGKKGEDDRAYGTSSEISDSTGASISNSKPLSSEGVKPNAGFQSGQTMSDKGSINVGGGAQQLGTSKSLEESAEDRLLERFGKTRSALGPGTVIQGRLTFDTTVRIDGKLSGDVFSSKAIIVGKTGSIDAQIEVGALIVIGYVKGEIRATERIEILGGGYVEGSVETPCLVVESGSTLNGECKMMLKGRSAEKRSDKNVQQEKDVSQESEKALDDEGLDNEEGQAQAAFDAKQEPLVEVSLPI
jgi:cytoskeletal protein CcmA (bactofilin family)